MERIRRGLRERDEVPCLSGASRGLVDGRVGVGGLRVEVSHHRPNTELPLHSHEQAGVLFVLGGVLEEEFEGHTCRAGPGTVIQKPGGVPHSDHIGSSPTVVLYVEVLAERLGRIVSELGLLEAPGHFFAPDSRSAALRLVALLRSRRAPHLLIEAVALEFLVSLSRSAKRNADGGSRLLSEATRLLDGQLESPPPMEELALATGASPGRLRATFKRLLAESPDAYIRRRRLEEAARRLATEDTPIASIASDLGFSDQAHLTRRLREVYGLPPGRYRRRLTRTLGRRRLPSSSGRTPDP